MAKAKQTKSSAEPEAKKAAKKSAAPEPAAAPSMINTALAAENAAKMLAAGVNRNTAANASAPAKTETAAFKQLKAGINKPHATTMSGLLNKSHGPDLSHAHARQKQTGHNQTFGANLTRSGVPRRTPG